MTYTVTVEGLVVSFGGDAALDGVDLAIAPGAVLALLGPNGAGKTTLVRVLATLLRPDAGRATVAGHDVVADPDGVRRSISLSGQSVAVDDVLTGRENLEMIGELRRLDRKTARARATELLAQYGLADAADRRVKTYSGGMRRRLDLAASLVTRPQVLFLDEPTTGLDPRSRIRLWDSVREIVAAGVTVLLTTQYLEEADQLADTVVMLDHGRVVARGTPAELKASLGAERVRLQFAHQPAYAAALTVLDRVASTDDRHRLVDVATEGSVAEVHEVLDRLASAGIPASRVSTHRPSLDDVFLSLTDATARTSVPAGEELAS